MKPEVIGKKSNKIIFINLNLMIINIVKDSDQ